MWQKIKSQVLKPDFFVLLMVIFMAGCESPKKTEALPPLKEVLPGAWSTVSPSGTYWEHIMTDTLYWFYSDELGTWRWRYVVSGDTLKRFYRGEYAPEYDLRIAKYSRDTLWLYFASGPPAEGVRDKSYGYTRPIINARVNLRNLDVTKIVTKDTIPTAGDSTELYRYTWAYRDRKYQWESSHKTP